MYPMLIIKGVISGREETWRLFTLVICWFKITPGLFTDESSYAITHHVKLQFNRSKSYNLVKWEVALSLFHAARDDEAEINVASL